MKRKLNPFDAELLVMIGDIAKSQPDVEEKTDGYEITVATTEIPGTAVEALKQAVAGRLGNRLLVTHTLDVAVIFGVKDDPTEYPEQIRTRLIEPDTTAGTRYCRILLEVDAIQVRRDNVDELLKFTGGGTMTTPRTPNAFATYSFPDANGVYIDVPETWYIIREDNGEFTTRSKRDFDAEFEPKGIRNVGSYEKAINPVIKEALELLDNVGDLERCENCETRLPYEQMLHDREGVPLCPECIEALKGDPDFELVGVIKIKEERESQIYEHGFDVSHDRKNNKYGEIKQAVAAILNNDLDLYARTGWDYEFYDHIKAKPELEQLAICGALVAAEIDRLTIKN